MYCLFSDYMYCHRCIWCLSCQHIGTLCIVDATETLRRRRSHNDRGRCNRNRQPINWYVCNRLRTAMSRLFGKYDWLCGCWSDDVCYSLQSPALSSLSCYSSVALWVSCLDFRYDHLFYLYYRVVSVATNTTTIANVDLIARAVFDARAGWSHRRVGRTTIERM